MRLSCLGLRGLLFAGAGLGLLTLRTPNVRAWAVTGDSLSLVQRDVRVFNNFTDASANSNTTPEPSFPGYVGAPLAVWKGAVEWASELHGDGNGDPQQPLGLGSGGANFDPSWQGQAAGVGGPDDNVMSEISGSGGGVIAFTETPTSDGWRIRFYASQIWFDDPDKTLFSPSERDLQGVATHEYGHALGLGHSTDPAATMYAVVPQGGLSWRTIESDDVAGVQAIYGAKSAIKPQVASYALPAPGMLLVRGANFSAGGNEVWFTQSGSAGDGTPVIASGLVSSAGGTEILLAIPAAAGPGDLLVRVPGQAFDALSNPFPFDPNGPPCLQPVLYGNAKTSSTGLPSSIGWTGQPSATSNSLQLTLFGPPVGETAVLFWGLGQQSVPFQGGELLVTRPFHRQATVTLDIFNSALVPVTSDPSLVGTTRCYQFWYSDAGDPLGVGTSDALAITFCP